jgi:calnexin
MFVVSFLTLSSCVNLSTIPRVPKGGYFHFQSFGDHDWRSNWVITSLANYTGIWELQKTQVPQALPDEQMIFMTRNSSYYGLSTAFQTPLDLTNTPLVVQYEVRLQETLQCGGLYLKLFGDANFSPATLSNETRHLIMFGPDRCASTNKVHFIFRHQNSKSGVIEEKHLKKGPVIKTDKINHLYTLIVRPDNTYEILIDAESVKKGSLFTDFAPPVNPPKEIDDPTDQKPSDWVDDEKIPDPTATKPPEWDETQPEFVRDPTKVDPPAGWLPDEPKFVPDPSATKPADWDDDIHGAWEPQRIANPKCQEGPGCGVYEAPLIKNKLHKGKWKAKTIANPAYKGKWKPRQIPNPDYVVDNKPSNFGKVYGMGFELWMVNKNVGFGNVWLGTDEEAVRKWNREHFLPKFKAQEAEQKRLEPKKGRRGEVFFRWVRKFAEWLTGFIARFFSGSVAKGIGGVSGIGALPILLICCFCRRKMPARKGRQQAKARMVKKEVQAQVVEKAGQTDGREEPKVGEEKEETKGEEDQPRHRSKTRVEDE